MKVRRLQMVFTFVDLCCGIGGFHLACASQGGVCIQACDIDPGARSIYAMNFHHTPETDVRSLSLPTRTPDLVCFGNPCQPFSSMGKRKGLADDRGGKVFIAICKHLMRTGAKSFIMENVKGLAGHPDFQKMCTKLRKCGYILSTCMLDAMQFGTPQHRERVFVVGVHETFHKEFSFERLRKKRSIGKCILDILDPGPVNKDLLWQKFSTRFHIDPHAELPVPTKSGFVIRAQLSAYTDQRLFSSQGTLGTILSTQPPVIYDERYKTERRLSKSEMLRCQGFPAAFKWPKELLNIRLVTKYVGNAVHVGTVKAIVKELVRQGFLKSTT